MDSVSAAAPIRLARPSPDLVAAERFWVDGVGLEVLWRTDAQVDDHHALLMVGLPGAGWHLELVGDTESASTSHPGEEDLLVIYLGSPPEPGWLDRIVACGGARVAARNPYWDQWGVTVEDPDGYRLVLSTRTWD